jgi:hypothetical protein
VAVGERSALGVLPGEPDRYALDEQAREGKAFGLGPVDAALVADRLPATIELLLELGVDGEALGNP